MVCGEVFVSQKEVRLHRGVSGVKCPGPQQLPSLTFQWRYSIDYLGMIGVVHFWLKVMIAFYGFKGL